VPYYIPCRLNGFDLNFSLLEKILPRFYLHASMCVKLQTIWILQMVSIFNQVSTLNLTMYASCDVPQAFDILQLISFSC